MTKKKFFSSGVLIILLVACVAFSAELFGCAPGASTKGDSGAGPQTPGEEALAGGGEGDGLSEPIIAEWVLPVIVSITGADSDAGMAAAWGFDYGVKAVNELGGIRGLPVRITIRDAASNDTAVPAEISSAAADALIILGPPTETQYKAGEQTFYSAGMPVVGAATDNGNREAYSPFAISCISDPASAAVSAAETWVRAERFEKVYIFYSALYSDRIASAEEAFVAADKEIVEKDELVNDAFDAASVAEKAFASGADAYYLDMGGEDMKRIVKQLKYLAGDKASELKILCGPQAADKALIENAVEGEMLGVRVWTAFDPVKDGEKRKAFDDAFNKNVDDYSYYSFAVDYYQAAHMLKQAIDALGLTGAPEALAEEREKLATYLYNTGLITTDQGDFIIESGSKLIVAKLYRVTEKGFQT